MKRTVRIVAIHGDRVTIENVDLKTQTKAALKNFYPTLEGKKRGFSRVTL